MLFPLKTLVFAVFVFGDCVYVTHVFLAYIADYFNIVVEMV